MTTITDPRLRDPATAARGRWLMLVVLLAGQFMALLDVTVVNVAMPTIGRTLHASGAELQLVVAGYTVSYAMMLITGARLGHLYGRRRVFLAGVAVFTLASLTCGIAPGIGVLVGARFVQGAGAAAMMPQIMSVIQVRFDGAARARALSAYTAVLSSGFVAGQVLGGVLVTANLFGQTWRPVFLVNVASVLRSGGSGGVALQAGLVITCGALALGFSPLVTHALVRVPLRHAADASGLLTTTIQLGQAVGVATFGSLFLTLDSGHSGHGAAVSGHALAITMSWLAAVLLLGVVAGIPLARTVAAARRSAAAEE
jgi:MFS family permease